MAIEQNGNYSPSERIVSPGVFTREIDQSFLAQGVAAIGGVVVAPFKKGPGFSPTVITSEGDLANTFGDPDGVLYGPTTAQQYLRQQGQVTVVRVGGLGGYEQNDPLIISAVPGQYARYMESGSFTGTILNATYTYVNTGSWRISGSLQLEFSSGIYSGSTVLVGDINFLTTSGSTSASQGSGTNTFHSTSFMALPLTSSVLAGATITNTRVVTGSITLSAVSSCASELNIEGILSGSYGAFNPNAWTPAATSSMTCGTASLVSGSDEVVLAVLANTAYDRGQNLYGFNGSILTSKDTTDAVDTDFMLQLSSSYLDTDTNTYVSSSYGLYEFSIDPESSAYVTNVFGTDPNAGFTPVAAGQKIEAAYTYKHFEYKAKRIVSEMLASGSWKIQISTPGSNMKFTDGITPDEGTSTFDLTNAYTPFIRSQKISAFNSTGSGIAYDLFQVHTISDGDASNKMFKVEISNVRSPGSISGTKYGSFSLVVRQYGDTDAKSVIVERYDNLNLDVNSSNYVARRIGDTYNYIDFNGKIIEIGNYPQKSKNIRVEMATAPWPVDAIPFGFGPYASPIGGDYAALGQVPSMSYCAASAYLLQPGRYCSGVVFQPAPSNADADLRALYPQGSAEGSELDNKQYFAPVPYGASAEANAAFDLETDAGVTPLYVASEESVNVKKRRFILGFQGGFDGQSPSIPVLVGDDIVPTNQQGLNCSTNTSYGSYAYKQALTALSNADEFDFNLITVPGINYEQHPYVAGLTIEICENRGDAFYIMDIAPNQNAGDAAINNVVGLAGQFDTNYAATYYPWVKVVDTNTNKIMPVPPSVVMMSVYAANDKVSAEWFAPAGLNRGGIPTAVSVADRLTHTERDTLYEGHVNPIAAFPGQGVVAWGQKTLQRNPSALDRINVRRLLIALKKFIASSSRYLVFEQNVATTRQRFLNIVNPYLESVQQRSGIYAFKVVMDDTNNTPDLVDRNILYGQIYIQPTRTAEFIVLDFNVLPTGATFPGA